MTTWVKERREPNASLTKSRDNPTYRLRKDVCSLRPSQRTPQNQLHQDSSSLLLHNACIKRRKESLGKTGVMISARRNLQAPSPLPTRRSNLRVVPSLLAVSGPLPIYTPLQQLRLPPTPKYRQLLTLLVATAPTSKRRKLATKQSTPLPMRLLWLT